VRELEFLPDWYPQLRTRRRRLLLQSWASVALVGASVLWLGSAHRAIGARAAELNDILGRAETARGELRKLDDLLVLQRQCQQKARVIDRLGLHVEATRLVNKLEEVMPREMGVLDLKLDVEETPRPPRVTTASRAAAADATAELPPERRLKVSVHGVVPTDVDFASFLAGLSTVPYFENVAMIYAKDRSDSGHVMREFEVTFSVSLNQEAISG